MFTCRQLPGEAFVEIGFSAGVTALYGAKISYSCDGQTFRPCAIFRGRDADSLLDGCFWEWNEAVQYGNVKLDGPPHTLYWHRYLNEMQHYRGPATLRVEALLDGDVRSRDLALELEPCTAIFLDDWSAAVADTAGWQVQDGRLSVVPGAEAAPLRVPPGAEGRFDIYLGVGHGTLNALVRVSDEAIRYPVIVERGHPELEEKAGKEIFWKTADLHAGAAIEIAPSPATLREPAVWPFGSLDYLKLSPAAPPAPAAPARRAGAALAIYFEPYTWAFYYGLQEPWRVREALALFREMGADEIHTQVVRFGSQSLHHGRIAERHDRGALMGDDGTFSPGPTEMVRSLDVLREAIAACRDLGVTHYANAALTNCYPGTALDDAICRDHPEWVEGSVLRFNRPETRGYAAGIAAEFAEWGADHLSIDCMRYPYHHTEDDLLAVFREMHAAVRAAAGGRDVPFTARIPAGDITFYRAFAQLAREGIVQCVIPSSLFMREPLFSLKPYLAWQRYGCRVYGIIDGWLAYVGAFNNFQLSLNRTPRDIREDMTRFLDEGADGIFVYQGDVHCADPFNRMVFADVLGKDRARPTGDLP